jgi:DNA-directed RNA polymerase subunit RPC12/RpoP
MKYYCKNCGSVFNTVSLAIIHAGMRCPCGKRMFAKLPDYETPQQYEKRTGNAYPDNGLVWVQYYNKGNYGEFDGWLVETYLVAKKNIENYELIYEYIVITDPPVPPPKNWKPEKL